MSNDYNNNYNQDSIQVLSDIEHIRKRSGMYIGDAVDPSQLLSEIIDNAMDEVQSGYGNKIIISVNTEKNEYSVRDFGRGIPHGKKMTESGTEKEILEILITKSNSGGKFDGKSYNYSVGLHGLGLTLTNALSKYISIKSYRGNTVAYVNAIDGVVDSVGYENNKYDDPDGTWIRFSPDPKYFESEIIPFTFIVNRCRILRSFGFEVDLYKNNELQDLSNYNNLFDLLPKSNISYCRSEVKYESDNGEMIRVALDYTSETNTNLFGYTNLLYNRYGGTHTRRIQKSVSEVWSKFYNEVPTELKPSDCLLGLNILVAVFIHEVAFSSQTKEKLSVPSWSLDSLMTGFEAELYDYLLNNPELRKGLLKRFEEYRISQNKLLSQKEIMSAIKINNAKDSNSIRRRQVVPGLIECTSTSRDGTELYLVEGKSAAGPIARARDRKHQSVLPLRGKIKNATYMSIKDAIKSETIRNIVNAIGAGIGEDADPNKSRYEKIIIATDADSDGSHIVALILSTLVNVTAPLVKAGMVYVLVAPLYGYTLNGNRHYCNTMEEIPQDASNITRYKGLGEMDDDEFRDSCLFQGKRTLYRVDYPENLDHFNEILGTSEGRSKLLHDLGIIKYVNSDSDTLMEDQ